MCSSPGGSTARKEVQESMPTAAHDKRTCYAQAAVNMAPAPPLASLALRFPCDPIIECASPFIHSNANSREERLGSLPRLLAELPCVLEELEPRA